MDSPYYVALLSPYIMNQSAEVPNARLCAVCRKKRQMHTFPNMSYIASEQRMPKVKVQPGV